VIGTKLDMRHMIGISGAPRRQLFFLIIDNNTSPSGFSSVLLRALSSEFS
jgi:hypothetical protein